MTSILKHHFSMSGAQFRSRHAADAGPRRDVWIEEKTPTVEGVIDRVSRIPWGWINKEIYDRDVLSRRLAEPGVRLFDLCAKGEKQPIGYALIVPPERKLKHRFWGAANDQSVIEIENLALFPGHEGQGRGWSFFQLVMAQLYRDYDIVYWSQSSTNFPTLKAYYERQGMSFRGSDEVPDFRQRRTAEVVLAAE